MIFLNRPKNVKVCPGCGTCLINTVKHCSVCGHTFSAAGPELHGPIQITLSLPAFIGLILFLFVINTLVILGLQKREQNQTLVLPDETTATFSVTSTISPTPSPISTRTPAPPTETPVVDITYVVREGDSCLSIADQFNIYLDRLLAMNDIDCSLLNVGTILIIPPALVTLEPTITAIGATPP
jgi:hypothetical protein